MGHVFVIRGDIANLACDAWMLPTSAALGVTRWEREVPGLQRRMRATDTSGLRSRRTLTAPLAGGSLDEPAIVLTAVPERGFSDARALAPAVDAFFAEAAAVRSSPTGGRERRLVALPFFGTRGGGGASRCGEILDVLLQSMLAGTDRYDIDAVLVLLDPDAYALAQLKRAADDRRFFPELGPDLRSRLDVLVADARSGRLVPFMGAGVSASAGAPTWQGLIEALALEILGDSPAVASLLRPSRDNLDQAAALRAAWEERRKPDDPSFNELVAEQVRLDRYGLAPALLASLPANEAITLNYDSLFERASDDAGKPRRVIPAAKDPAVGDRTPSNERWLLKLHGSVDAAESIVLTRDDYLGYDQDRAALTSLVKAMLMTRHLLFVGFGLADDHFHEILFDVRRAVSGQGSGALDATVLALTEDPLDELLWKDHLDIVAFGDDGDSTAELARRLEIFLDALLCFASDDHSYLLRAGFGRALTPAEQRLKQLLEHLQAEVDGEIRMTPAWAVIAETLSRLGGGEQARPPDRDPRGDDRRRPSQSPAGRPNGRDRGPIG